jgi:hypothetical protein
MPDNIYLRSGPDLRQRPPVVAVLGLWDENRVMSDNRATQERQLDAYEALRAGAKRTAEEIAQLGGAEQFRKPGEHHAPVRNQVLPKPSLTTREFLKRYPTK